MIAKMLSDTLKICYKSKKIDSKITLHYPTCLRADPPWEGGEVSYTSQQSNDKEWN